MVDEWSTYPWGAPAQGKQAWRGKQRFKVNNIKWLSVPAKRPAVGESNSSPEKSHVTSAPLSASSRALGCCGFRSLDTQPENKWPGSVAWQVGTMCCVCVCVWLGGYPGPSPLQVGPAAPGSMQDWMAMDLVQLYRSKPNRGHLLNI